MSTNEKLLQVSYRLEQQFSLPVLFSVCYGGWRDEKMVFLRGEVGLLPLQEGEHHRGQGGELPPAGSQLYPGHGPEVASVSKKNWKRFSSKFNVKF